MTAATFAARFCARRQTPSSPTTPNRVVIHRFNQRSDGGRNVIGRGFCRLEDCRRIATRYDEFGRSFLAAVHLPAYRLD
jgi:transposase